MLSANGKRTAPAAEHGMDMLQEGLIDENRLMRVQPANSTSFDQSSSRVEKGPSVSSGLPAARCAGGKIVFTSVDAGPRPGRRNRHSVRGRNHPEDVEACAGEGFFRTRRHDSHRPWSPRLGKVGMSAQAT